MYAVRHVYAGTSATQAQMAHRAQHPVVNTVSTVVLEYSAATALVSVYMLVS